MIRKQKILAALLVSLLLVGLALPAWAEEVKGRIASVRPNKNEVVLTDNFKNWTFQMDGFGKVFINNRPATVGDLQTRDEAVVTFNRDGDRLIARVIRTMRE